MNKKQKKQFMLLAFALLGMLFVSNIAMSSNLIITGWEVENGLYAVTENGEYYTIWDVGLKPDNVYLWGEKGISFDSDNEFRGTPNIDATLGAPREQVIDLISGGWTPARAGESYKTYSKTVGETVYFWDHHKFMFDVQVVATPNGHYNILVVTEGEGDNMPYSLKSEINLQVYFETNPWINAIIDQLTEEDSTYELDESKVWSSIMSAQILSVDAKFVGNDDPDNGRIDVKQSAGSQLTLYNAGGGTFSRIADGDYPISQPSSAAQDFAIFELAADLAPAWGKALFGGVAVYPAQVTWTVMVDVLTTAGYDLISGDMNPDVEDKEIEQGVFDPLGDFFAAIGGFFAALQGPFYVIALVLILGFSTYIIFKLGFLKKLFKRKK